MAAPPDPDDLLATLTDKRGRTVYLTVERWEGHITDPEEGHPEMANYLEDVKKAVRTAEIRTQGRWPDTERLWAPNLAGGRWVTVVVRYEGRVGYVRTAHRFNRGPRNEQRL